MNFKQASQQSEIQVCASCHARRESLGANSVPSGERFDDHHRLALLREGLYHADGQILDEVYVYGSFLQSKMYQHGVSCNNCHNTHNTKLVKDVDAVCLQCHNPTGNKKFPTLKLTQYDTTAHHHYDPDSEDAQCVNCHMPSQTYMGVDARRDHSFRVPRPDLSIKLGVPNACNNCHAKQTAGWAQGQVAQWFPQGQHLQPHYGEILHAGRQGLNQSSVTGLIGLALNPSEPAIARASALELLAPGVTPAVAGQVLPLLKDSSSLVRMATLGLFRNAPSKSRAKYSASLLEDPIRSVRIAAAQRILDIPTNHLSKEDQAIVKTVVDEYKASLEALADFPEVQMNIASYAERVRRQTMAQQSLRAAIKLDTKLTEAWLRLAQLQVSVHKFEPAKKTLQRAIAANLQNSSALYHLLGRVLVQLNDNSAAAQAFEQTLEQLPDDLGIRVEYASVLTKSSKFNESIKLLKQAGQAAQFEANVLYLLAYNHIKLNQLEQGRHFAKELMKHHPKDKLNEHIQALFH